jgi:hypothetical protein
VDEDFGSGCEEVRTIHGNFDLVHPGLGELRRLAEEGSSGYEVTAARARRVQGIRVAIVSIPLILSCDGGNRVLEREFYDDVGRVPKPVSA